MRLGRSGWVAPVCGRRDDRHPQGGPAMTRIPLVTRVLLGSLVVVLIAGAQSSMQTRQEQAKPFISLQPEEIKPAEGATQKILSGDPAKPGIYVVENTFVPGRMSRPHFHDQDRYITVIKGTWWVSLG